MAISVIPTESFAKDLKAIIKKHKGIIQDIAELAAMLKANPTMGTSLGQNVYKIRLSVTGTGKGKSGGAR